MFADVAAVILLTAALILLKSTPVLPVKATVTVLFSLIKLLILLTSILPVVEFLTSTLVSVVFVDGVLEIATVDAVKPPLTFKFWLTVTSPPALITNLLLFPVLNVNGYELYDPKTIPSVLLTWAPKPVTVPFDTDIKPWPDGALSLKPKTVPLASIFNQSVPAIESVLFAVLIRMLFVTSKLPVTVNPPVKFVELDIFPPLNPTVVTLFVVEADNPLFAVKPVTPWTWVLTNVIFPVVEFPDNPEPAVTELTPPIDDAVLVFIVPSVSLTKTSVTDGPDVGVEFMLKFWT